MVFQAIVIIRDEERITMNTATQRAVDSEKKIWTQPVLTRLDVGETAGGKQPRPNCDGPMIGGVCAGS